MFSELFVWFLKYNIFIYVKKKCYFFDFGFEG